MTVSELFDGPVIDVRDLFCLYPVPDGTVAALRGLSLAVEAGERLLVHGPNGSGKTTLLRVLTGLQPASAGLVRIAGVDLVGADERTCNALRLKGLGIVDQHSARALRPELCVAANVAMSLQLAGVRRSSSLDTARRTLDELGIGELADRRPGSLSGGEAQRVAVCAAVAHRPAVVLADEPTGELDAVAAEQVYDLLAQATARIGATLVLVTHDAGAVRVADRVVRIRDGRLSEQWHPDAPANQTLVVDDRGWVRLPESLRRASGADTGVRADLVEGSIRLTGTGSTTGLAHAKCGDVGARRVGDVIARANSIEVRYPGRVVFSGCDLEVPAAALTVIAGRSGAGKSTLLRVLVGLTEPDSGDVELFGEKVRPLDRAGRADLRRRFVAMASQMPALVEAVGAEDNLALARTARGLAPDPGLASKVLDSLGLAALRTRPVRFLSGGERQRVALARCLVVQRPLVVLDEPTSQQDEAHAELVAQALAEAADRGTAVLCASHDPVLVESADRVVRLS